MKVKSIAKCSPWSFLQYFWPTLAIIIGLENKFLVILSARFTQVLLYSKNMKIRTGIVWNTC